MYELDAKAGWESQRPHFMSSIEDVIRRGAGLGVA